MRSPTPVFPFPESSSAVLRRIAAPTYHFSAFYCFVSIKLLNLIFLRQAVFRKLKSKQLSFEVFSDVWNIELLKFSYIIDSQPHYFDYRLLQLFSAWNIWEK